MTATEPAASPTRLREGGLADRSARSRPPGNRPTWAEIDLDAIAANVSALKAQAAAPGLMAVVKADGYGHGAVPSARAALEGGADWLAVALVEEGQVLRAAGIDAPVLLLTEPPPEHAPAVLAAGLTPAVYTHRWADALSAAAEESGEPVPVHCKLDTGMRRVGVPPADWESAMTRLRDDPHLRFEGLWSHFAVADEPDNPVIATQAEDFARGCELAEQLGAGVAIRHLANTAGTLHLHEHHHDMVRPGLGVFGMEPAPGLAGDAVLRPALALYSELSLVKDLAANEAVSYGLVWSSPVPTVLGTVPAGYADGVTRALTGVGEVVHRGRRVPIAGRVCMDQFCVDIGAGGTAAAGDEVVLIGRQGDAAVTADDWARWLGTINYEVTCGIGVRVPRVHVRGGGG